MSKIICKKCGNVIELNNDEAEKEINRRVKERENEIRKLIESESLVKINELKSEVEHLVNEKNSAVKEKSLELTNTYNEEITKLKSQLENKDKEKKLEIESLLNKHQSELVTLESEIKKVESAKELEINNALRKQEDIYNKEKAKLNEELAYYKDFKAGLSVKEIGESLEQYCQNKFNEQRLSAYPNAYFEKDSDTKINGEKGDYIFRDYIVNGENKRELVSILFDMKHEADKSLNKKKNSEHLKKLDSDRKAKNCEYAVLVSTLETDNSFYGGITDVSYEYPKMYVVRPQCFMAIISLLKNAALKAENVSLQLEEYKNQNLDITNLEKEIIDFKEDFMSNVGHANDHFEKAIAGIDDTINKLTKTRKELVDSMMQLGRADTKVQQITMRKLTKNSPSIRAKLKEEKQDK